MIVLDRPLVPDDSLELHFSIQNRPNTIFTRNSGVLGKWYLLLNDILPRIGLPFQPERLHPSDSTAWIYHYQASDAHLVDIKTNISTLQDQLAIGPGELVKEQVSEGQKSLSISGKKYQIRI